MAVEKILVNFPTNFGDTVLALPAFDRVCAAYPRSRFTAIASPQTKDFLLGHGFIDEVIVYDKHMSLRQKMRFSFSLRGQYQAMVDFKHSLLPLLVGTRIHTPLLRFFPGAVHARDEYLRLVDGLVPEGGECPPSEFMISEEAKARWDSLRLGGAVCIATSSNSSLKQYPYHHLRKVVEALVEKQKVVLLGDKKSRGYYGDIASISGVTDLAGETSLIDLYYILSHYVSVCLTSDSSIMHLASYLNVPVCALFGPTDLSRYGPWSERFTVLAREDLPCRPCGKAFCPFSLECMDIDPGKIITAIAGLSAYENP